MEDALEDFKRTIDEALPRLLSIPDEQTLRPRAEGKWTPREIIGHLIDSASNNHQRFVRAQFKDDLLFQGYEQEAWVKAQKYNEEPWSLLVNLWHGFNLHLLHMMRHAPEHALKTPRLKHNLHELAWQTVPESEPATLEYFMRDYIGHLKNHLRQILE